MIRHAGSTAFGVNKPASLRSSAQGAAAGARHRCVRIACAVSRPQNGLHERGGGPKDDMRHLYGRDMKTPQLDSKTEEEIT